MRKTSGLLEEMAPLLEGGGAKLHAGLGDGRKFVHPLVGADGHDDGARVVRFSSTFPRIERTAPGLANKLDVFAGITTGGHSPENVKGIAGVNIMVNHYHEAAEIVSGVDVGRQRGSLSCVSCIGLLDGDDIEEPSAARLVAPDAFNTG